LFYFTTLSGYQTAYRRLVGSWLPEYKV